MISQDLLVKAGVIDMCIYLHNSDNARSLEMITDEVSVSSSTVRNRARELTEEGIFLEDSELIDDTPTRVYGLTSDGQEVARNLSELVTNSKE